ncbi:terminase [Streptomyces sp. NPDC127112]|uniref:terminase n=1 Tax=Streptomyces sp. NPDC127112 TaxID=3345364 RepID=UPI00362C38C1
MTITYEAVRTMEDYVPPKNRTLAPAIFAWAKEHFRDDWEYTSEQKKVIARWYEIDGSGKFRYTSGTMRRMKGHGKDPFWASILWIELLGPCRFGGWDTFGQPIAVEVAEPWVQVFATSSDQNTNTISAFQGFLKTESLEQFSVQMGQEKTYAINAKGTRCRLEAKASSYRAAEGGRPSLALCNETWHWVEGNHGHKLYDTIRANCAKVGGRTMQITNAPVLGEDSVAERTYYDYMAVRDGKMRDAGLYYDSIEAPAGVDMADEESLTAAIVAARGDSWWVDPERIIPEIWSASVPLDVSKRKYLNTITMADDAIIDPEDWTACEVQGEEIKRGERIILALDGGETDDATAIVAMRARDQFVQLLALWEKPDGPEAQHWSIDHEEVSDRVAHVFANYNVIAFFSDVARWETYVNKWSETYGPKLEIKATGKSTVGFDMRQNQREITTEHEAMVGAIENHRLKHDGNFRLRRHVENARKRYNQYGMSFGKESRESKKKVDAYAAMLLCCIARKRLVEAGKLNGSNIRAAALRSIGGF